MKLREEITKLTADHKKKSIAVAIINLLTRKEYNQWVKKLSKCSTPEAQEAATAKYFKKVGKYEQLKEHVRIQ